MTLSDDEPLTANDFIEFLADRGIDSKCQRCTNSEWRTGEGNQIKGFLPIGTDEQGDFRKSDYSIPVQYLICTNCGHIELFGTKVVRRWKADRKAKMRSGGGENG